MNNVRTGEHSSVQRVDSKRRGSRVEDFDVDISLRCCLVHMNVYGSTVRRTFVDDVVFDLTFPIRVRFPTPRRKSSVLEEAANSSRLPPQLSTEVLELHDEARPKSLATPPPPLLPKLLGRSFFF